MISFPPCCSWKIPNIEVLGLRMGRNGQMERSLSFDRTGPTEKSGPPRKVDRFFRNFSGWTEPIHSVLDRNFRKCWLNGSRPGAPCLLDRGTRLGGIAFYHVNGSCRAIPGSRGEINRENKVLRGEFFLR